MHRCAHLCIISAAVTNALRLGRRAAVGAITGTALLPVPSKAFEVKLPFDEDADTRRRRLNAELKAPPISDEVRACGSRLVGTYTDPKHPGCERRVAQIAGTRFASIRGVDEDGVPWVAGASIACADYNGVGKEQLIVGLRVEINLSSSRICGCSMAWRPPRAYDSPRDTRASRSAEGSSSHTPRASCAIGGSGRSASHSSSSLPPALAHFR